LRLTEEANVREGEYEVALRPHGLAGLRGAVFVIINPPRFQLQVSIRPRDEVVSVRLGAVPGPVTDVDAMLPDDLNLRSVKRILVRFKDFMPVSILADERELLR